MADDHDAEPLGREAADELEHLGGLHDAERRGRLVEDHQARLAEQRARDRDGLALAAGERADRRAHARQRGHAERVDQLDRLVLHRALVERPCAGQQLAAEEEVRDDIEVVAEREVLVDGRDPVAVGVGRAADVHAPAVDRDRPGVGGLDAGDRLDQRRLARAVVTDESNDLAGVDLEVDVHERLDRTEVLGHAGGAEERRPAGGGSSSVCVVSGIGGVVVVAMSPIPLGGSSRPPSSFSSGERPHKRAMPHGRGGNPVGYRSRLAGFHCRQARGRR